MFTPNAWDCRCGTRNAMQFTACRTCGAGRPHGAASAPSAKRCVHCGTQQVPTAAYCNTCGQPLTHHPGPPAAAPGWPQPGPNHPPGLSSGAKIGFGIVAALVALVPLGSILPRSEGSWRISAKVETEHRVSLCLKNPKSADFPYDRQTIEKTGERQYRVSGIVYSTNSFNATVPTEYDCELAFLDGDRVRVLRLVVGDEVVIGSQERSRSADRYLEEQRVDAFRELRRERASVQPPALTRPNQAPARTDRATGYGGTLPPVPRAAPAPKPRDPDVPPSEILNHPEATIGAPIASGSSPVPTRLGFGLRPRPGDMLPCGEPAARVADPGWHGFRTYYCARGHVFYGDDRGAAAGADRQPRFRPNPGGFQGAGR